MTQPRSAQPYRSAMDLPSFVELHTQLQGVKLLTRLVARQLRPEIVKLEEQLQHLGRLVDRFYELLGERNWVFHDDLSTEEVERIIGPDATPESAEQGLIAIYQEPGSLSFMTRRLAGIAGLRVRQHLIERALHDHEEGRYYAAVLVLLTVMEGFVNDIESRRRGLHARNADEMVAWDSVVGHHMGLSHAHKAFTKSTGRTTSDEVVELHRHGIVHGTILNYDNLTVAMKAWNRLFAVADWARSLARRNQPPQPKPSFKQVLSQLAETQRTKEALKQWRPSALTAGDAGFEDQEVLRQTRGFLEAWQRRNYGQMGASLPAMHAGPTPNATAGRARDIYERHTLTAFTVERLDYQAAAACEVDVTLTINGVSQPGRMRWIREKDDGSPAIQEQDGRWRLYIWDPVGILRRATVQDAAGVE